MVVLLGTGYYWAGWMQKKEGLPEPQKCSLEEATPSVLFEVPKWSEGKYFRLKKERETEGWEGARGVCEIMLRVLGVRLLTAENREETHV